MQKFYNRIYITGDVYLTDRALAEISTLSSMSPLSERDGGQHRDAESCDAIVAGWKTTIDSGLLGRFPNLKYVGLRCTSTGNVDVEYLRGRNVVLTNLGHYGDFGTAEFVMQQMLNVARTRTSDTSYMAQGEIRGKTLGVIGFGSVGRLVCEAAAGFGMDVYICTKSGRPEGLSGALARCRFGSLEEVVSTADFVSVHTPAYAHVLSREVLMLSKPQVVIFATTLGLPFNMADISDFLVEDSSRQVVCDLCAAGHVPAEVMPERFNVLKIYAARTPESVDRAENELIANLKRFGKGDFNG